MASVRNQRSPYADDVFYILRQPPPLSRHRIFPPRRVVFSDANVLSFFLCIAPPHRSKTLPVTHHPNWNDVRIIRSMLSLLKAALRDERTTHVLLCTESCVPVATLRKTARSVLLNENCPCKEEGGTGRCDNTTLMEGSSSRQKRDKTRIDWNRSYVDCYDKDSHRWTRLDEHNCWDVLRDSVPSETIYKAMPGWSLLSRKHARGILDLPVRPTSLAIGGSMEEVAGRALTHSRWDERASDHRDRAHPLSYDSRFDDDLVSRVRRDGSLFLRKLKRPLNLSVWEQIVVGRRRGGQDMGRASSDQGMMRGGRGLDAARGPEREHEYSHRQHHRDEGGHVSRYSRSGRHGSRGNYDSERWREDDDCQRRHKRGRSDHSRYDSSRERQRWRR